MSIAHDHRSNEDRPAPWAVGVFAFSVLALLGAFALLAAVP
jgi:hypothetical protein